MVARFCGSARLRLVVEDEDMRLEAERAQEQRRQRGAQAGVVDEDQPRVPHADILVGGLHQLPRQHRHGGATRALSALARAAQVEQVAGPLALLEHRGGVGRRGPRQLVAGDQGLGTGAAGLLRLRIEYGELIGTGAAIEREAGERPALRAVLQCQHRVAYARGPQAERTDNAAGAAGAGDDDRHLFVRHHGGEAMGKLAIGQAPRALDPHLGELGRRAGVEEQVLPALLLPLVQRRGVDGARMVRVLQHFAERLARHVHAGEHAVSRRRPGRHAALDEAHIGVAARREPLRRARGDTIAVVDEQHRRIGARDEGNCQHFEPAIGARHGEERVPFAESGGFANVEEGDLPAGVQTLLRGCRSEAARTHLTGSPRKKR